VSWRFFTRFSSSPLRADPSYRGLAELRDLSAHHRLGDPPDYVPQHMGARLREGSAKSWRRKQMRAYLWPALPTWSQSRAGWRANHHRVTVPGGVLHDGDGSDRCRRRDDLNRLVSAAGRFDYAWCGQRCAEPPESEASRERPLITVQAHPEPTFSRPILESFWPVLILMAVM